MAYTSPKTTVTQVLSTVNAGTVPQRLACIVGGSAQLVRYNEASERDFGYLGFYDAALDTAYGYPTKATGAIIDQDYVKLFVRNALLPYFSDSLTVEKTGINTVTSASVSFKANGVAYPRAGSLYDRDVQVGDIVKARFIPAVGDPVTVWSTVRGFTAATVAAVVGTAAADADNKPNSSASATVTQLSGPYNAVDIDSASAANYDPYPTGQTSETYTIVVTASSTGGDLTTARLRVLSASGLDDAVDVAPAAAGLPTAIGSAGLTVIFDDTNASSDSESASEGGYSATDLLVGQKWRVVANAAFTKTSAPTAGGTYVGTTDTTYVVEVVSGTKYANGSPVIRVTTSTGVDVSGPTAVTAGVATPIGTAGVTATFAGTGLLRGDRYTIAATAVKAGAYDTIVLGNSVGAVADGTPCELTLYILKPTIEVGRNRLDAAPLVNYETSATEITVKSGITAYDATWTDGGSLMALPVTSAAEAGYGALYVEYRAWLQAEVGMPYQTTSYADLAGPVSPDNPLKYGAMKAMEGGAGAVAYAVVSDPAVLTAWADALDALSGTAGAYGIVPMTADPAVQSLVQAFVGSMSSPENKQWCTAWFAAPSLAVVPIVHSGSTVPGYLTPTTADSGACLCTITDDPNTSGTQYTRLECPAGNGRFISNGVAVGDIVRAGYAADGFGVETYSTYRVAEVVSEDQIRLETGPSAAVNTASKVEIWRNQTPAQEAVALARVIGAWGDRRVRCVFPDAIEGDGLVLPGYFAAATLAGMRSATIDQQSLTRAAVPGFTAAPRSMRFTKNQLDTIAAGGGLILAQDTNGGPIYVRHAVTTGDTNNYNFREEVVTSVADALSYALADLFEPYIGRVNLTEQTTSLLKVELLGLIEDLKSQNSSPLVGGLIIDATVANIAPHSLYKDRLVVQVNAVLAAPANNIEVTLYI